MSKTKQLVIAILRFLDDQVNDPDVEDSACESIVVARQCLEAAYKVTEKDVQTCAGDPSLPQIYEEGSSKLNINMPEASAATETPTTTAPTFPTPTPSERDEADHHKNEGNEHMKQQQYEQAISCYSKAINLDGGNSIYYCNRAAAYSKRNDNQKAIEDCVMALQIDPSYSKAYGRKGLAHAALHQLSEAEKCYEKALELDPTNESYKNNLDVTREKLKEQQPAGAASGLPGLPGMNMGGVDFSSFLSNPAMMNMAQSVLSNPAMQNMVSNLMTGAQTEQAGPEGLSNLLNVGQQLAQQMEQQNPDLVNQLRQEFRAPGQQGDQQPPENNDSSQPEGS